MLHTQTDRGAQIRTQMCQDRLMHVGRTRSCGVHIYRMIPTRLYLNLCLFVSIHCIFVGEHPCF